MGTDLSLLFEMETYNYAIMFIRLLFNVLLLIFIGASCLLIYYLLLISLETKAFKIDVMCLVGLIKCRFVGMILTLATLFVITSVIIGYRLAFPSIYLIYSLLFREDLGFTLSIMHG